MNQDQFKITKITQLIGVPEGKWAQLTKQSLSLMRRVYAAANWDRFNSDIKFMDSIFGIKKETP